MARDYTRRQETDPAAPYNVTPQTRVLALPADCAGQYAVVFTHGLGGDGMKVWDPEAGPNKYALFHQLARSGLPIICHDFNYPRHSPVSGDIDEPTAWGNRVYRDTLESIRTVLCPALGLRSDKLLLFGASAGFTGQLIYAQEHPERVAAVIGALPGITIEGVRALEVLDGITGGFGEAGDTGAPNTVNLAWGMGYSTVGQQDTDGTVTGNRGWYYGTSIAYESGSPRAGDPVESLDPRNMAAIAQLVNAGVPIRYYYSSADPVATYTDSNGVLQKPGADIWCPGIGIEPQLISTTHGHNDAQWGDLPALEIAQTFLRAP